MSLNNGLPVLEVARGGDPWCNLKGSQALGMRTPHHQNNVELLLHGWMDRNEWLLLMHCIAFFYAGVCACVGHCSLHITFLVPMLGVLLCIHKNVNFKEICQINHTPITVLCLFVVFFSSGPN